VLHSLRLTHVVVRVAVGAVLALTAAGATAALRAEAVVEQVPPDASRAMWVWDTSTPQATVDLAVSRGIGQLYAAVPPRVGSSPQLAQLTELSRLARERGLRVDALGGDPGWVDNPRWVVDNWLAPALATHLFDGVHVDIEPYATAAWQTKRSTVVRSYLSTLDTLVQAAGAVPVEADIPFWLDEVPAGKSTLDREVMRRTQGVTVMAYRNTAAGPDGTIAISAKAVAAGTSLGVPVRIGQETDDLGTDPVQTKQTFHGFTVSAMEEQLGQVVAAYGSSASFAGLAIHSATGYAAMAP
jgi:hypothetical protein